MNILYVDTNKISVEEAQHLHKYLNDKLEGELITLPMNTLLLLDVGLDRLYDLKNIIDSIIEVKSKS